MFYFFRYFPVSIFVFNIIFIKHWVAMDIGGENLVIKSVYVRAVRLSSPDLEITSETFNLLRDL